MSLALATKGIICTERVSVKTIYVLEMGVDVDVEEIEVSVDADDLSVDVETEDLEQVVEIGDDSVGVVVDGPDVEVDS